MKKSSRIKRKVVEWQTKDQGADPLTPRGRKFIKKEINKCDEKKLRNQLENQVFGKHDKYDVSGYWDYVGSKHESIRANPDKLNDSYECDNEND